jgi:hypothetical protein
MRLQEDVAIHPLVRAGAIVSLSLSTPGCGVANWMSSGDLSFPSAPPPASMIQLESEPAGAEAKSSIGPSCRTPCSLNITTARPFTITFSLDGYQPLTVPVSPRPTVDPVAGQALKFHPDPVYAQLEALPPPAKGKKEALPKTGPQQ